MITGTVTGNGIIAIPLTVLTVDGTSHSLDAIIDTGFNGFLTLPNKFLNAVGATPFGTRRAELGNGAVVELNTFRVRIIWHDAERSILALQAEPEPLVGMSLLWNSRVTFDALDGGAVTIDAIP